MLQLLRRSAVVSAVLAVVFHAGADAQLRRIVAKSVSASDMGSSLELELAGGGTLAVRLADGAVYVDGTRLGSYQPGGELDAGWRELLGDAMGLENGALAERLVAWQPPEGGTSAEVGRALDRAIEEALSQAPSPPSAPGTVPVSPGDERAILRALLRSADRLGALEGALEGVGAEYRLHVDEDVVIPEGSVASGTLVVIEGTLRVEGEVDGDVVVVGGALDVRETGRIRGEARIADARVLRNDGEIEGGVVDVLESERDSEAELRARIRDQVRDELRDELRRELRTELRDAGRSDGGFSLLSPFRSVIRGVGGVLENLVAAFVLGLLGVGFFAFAGENVDAIAETARRSPGRAAMVGFAGSFLLIPVWVLGAVALAVSIIGIPVAIAWIPLFPLAAALAALLGYVAVARNAGEWLAESDFPWTRWIQKSNPVFTLFGGLLGLLAAFMVGHVVSILPFLGGLGGLLFVVGVMVTFVAIQIGFGSVILTRGGRRREYHGAYDADAAWEAALDADPDLGEQPLGERDAEGL